MLSDLEARTIEAGFALRESPFGAALRAFHPGRRAQGGFGESLASLELNHGPAFHRTLWALDLMERTGQRVDLGPERDYLRWWQAGLQAVAGIASLCWGEIPVDLRIAVMDEDDLGALYSRYIPGSRGGGPPARALAFQGLDSGEVRTALDALGTAASCTPSYIEARERIQDLRSHGGRRTLLKQRSRIEDRLERATAEPLTLDEAREVMQETIRHGYDDAADAVRAAAHAVQAHDELINHVLWALLGLAEQEHLAPPLSGDVSPARQRGTGRHIDVRVTIRDQPGFLSGSPPSPFLLDAGLPLDGLYLSRRQHVQWRVATYVDIGGRRLAALEAAA